jgi:hypothetical protein
MSLANRLWGAPRIHRELLKLGIEVAQSTVAKYMAKSGRGRSQTWKTFLHNHAAGIAAMDFLVVPTVGKDSPSGPFNGSVTYRAAASRRTPSSILPDIVLGRDNASFELSVYYSDFDVGARRALQRSQGAVARHPRGDPRAGLRRQPLVPVVPPRSRMLGGDALPGL